MSNNIYIHSNITSWPSQFSIPDFTFPLYRIQCLLYLNEDALTLSSLGGNRIYVYEIYFPEPSSSSDVQQQINFRQHVDSLLCTLKETVGSDHWREISKQNCRWRAILDVTQFVDVPHVATHNHCPFLKSRLLGLCAGPYEVADSDIGEYRLILGWYFRYSAG